METFGKVLELLGTLIAMGGLCFAWWKASTRNNAWRARVVASLRVAFGRLAGSAEEVSRTVDGSDAAIGVDDARVIKHDKIPGHLADVYQQLDAVRAALRTNAATTRAEAEAAFAEAIEQLKTDQNSHTIRDLTWALGGLGITAIGIFIGIWV